MTMVRHPARDQGTRTGIALVVTQITPQLHGIVMPNCQLLAKIREKGVKFTRHRPTGRPFGKLVGLDEVAHHMTAETELAYNRPLTQTGSM
jgi:hypothetical protein